MKYSKTITLKDGVECCLRSSIESDGQAVWDRFNLTHGQTDYLLSYPDENSFDVMQEGQLLKKKSESSNETEIVAVAGNVVVGTAGIEAVGSKYKARHRAEFGTSVAKDFRGFGTGQALRTAGYTQLELSVVAKNERALSMHEKTGFVKYGINPKSFNFRVTGFQEAIYMRLEL